MIGVDGDDGDGSCSSCKESLVVCDVTSATALISPVCNVESTIEVFSSSRGGVL